MEYDREYILRDASTVSDADVQNRKRPLVVGRYPSLDDALTAAKGAA